MNLTPMRGRRDALPPCKLFSEMAEELGMSQQKLLGHMRCSAIPFPKPELRHRPNNRNWYSPAKVRTWWKARQHEIHEAAMPQLREHGAVCGGDTPVPDGYLSHPQVPRLQVELHHD